MIPSSILSAYGLLKTSIQANSPIASATPLEQAALVAAGQALFVSAAAARDSLGPTLDGPDPSGSASSFPAALCAIADATLDQAGLDDMLGAVGRITFNLEQV